MDHMLTAKETSVIAALHRLAKRWPETLWLFSAGGTLCVMRKGPDGGHIFKPGSSSIDPDYVVATVDIENSGGDW